MAKQVYYWDSLKTRPLQEEFDPLVYQKKQEQGLIATPEDYNAWQQANYDKGFFGDQFADQARASGLYKELSGLTPRDAQGNKIVYSNWAAEAKAILQQHPELLAKYGFNYKPPTAGGEAYVPTEQDFGNAPVVEGQSTTSTPTKLPSGVLVRDATSGRIYLVDNGKKRHITNMDTLNALPADKKYWTDIDVSHLDLPDGSAIDNLLPAAIKSKADAQKALTDTGINWQEPRGYQQQPTPTQPAPVSDQYQGVQMPTSYKTALNDVIANFSKYKGREPSTKEDWTNIAFMMTLPPQEVESRLSGKPIEQPTQPAPTQPAPTQPAPTQPTQPTEPVKQQPGETEVQPQPIGDSAVNHLYKLYLGRDANEQELAIYKNHPDDTVLRKDLEFARSNEAERTKTEAETKQAEIDKRTEAEANIVNGGQSPKVVEDNILVRFADDPTPNDPDSDERTVWVYNRNSKMLIPIVSQSALDSIIESTGKSNINLISSNSLNDVNSAFYNAQILRSSEGVQDDGTVPESTQIRLKYGQPQNDYLEDMATTLIDDNIFGLLKKDPNIGISQELLDQVKGDPNAIAKYINAYVYGKYTLVDIIRDLKIKQLAKDGVAGYENMQAFDLTMVADEWYNTTIGYNLRTDSNLSVPMQIGGVPTALLDNPLFKMSPEAFQTLIPPLDITSPEFQAEAEKIEAAWYDVVMQQAEAETAQAKAVADDNWRLFKESIEKKYGIELSNNANEAWSQFQQLKQGHTERGLGESGIYQEAVDKKLAATRRADDVLREAKVSEEEITKRNNLLNNGSTSEISAEVNRLQGLLASETDPTEKAKLQTMIDSFRPNQEMIDWFSFDNLKKLYPDQKDEYLNSLRNLVIDENGNFRSDIYRTLFESQFKTGEEKKTYQEGWVTKDEQGNITGGAGLMYKKALEAEKKYAPYMTGDPFSSYYEDYMKTAAQRQAESTAVDTSGIKPGGVPPSEIKPTEIPSATNVPTSAKTGTNTLLAYDQSGNNVYVTPGQYYPGISLTPPAQAQPQAQQTMPSAANQPTSSPTTTNTLKAYNQQGQAVYVKPGEYYQGISLTAPTTTPTTATPTPTPTATPTPTPTDTYWEEFKNKNLNKDWSTYTPISAPSEMKKYKDIQHPTGGSTLYGQLI